MLARHCGLHAQWRARRRPRPVARRAKGTGARGLFLLGALAGWALVIAARPSIQGHAGEGDPSPPRASCQEPARRGAAKGPRAHPPPAAPHALGLGAACYSCTPSRAHRPPGARTGWACSRKSRKTIKHARESTTAEDELALSLRRLRRATESGGPGVKTGAGEEEQSFCARTAKPRAQTARCKGRAETHMVSPAGPLS